MPTNPRFLFVLLLTISTPALAQRTVPASSANWILDGEQSTRTYGARVAHMGDVDGDGYGDVFIGDPDFDGYYLLNTGRITLHPGSAGGLSTSPSWTVEGSTFERMGLLHAVGDVNADGFDDFVRPEGHIQFPDLILYFGSSTGPVISSLAPDGESVVGGDVNGDGINDLIVTTVSLVEVYLGSAYGLLPTAWTSLQIPHAVNEYAVQDVNGDGYADLAYLFNDCPNKHCNVPLSKLGVNLGSALGFEQEPKRTVAFAANDYARLVAPAGDLNGDGYGDLAVLIQGGTSRIDDVLVFYGSRNGFRPRPDSVLQAPIGAVEFETEGIGAAGDLNGDGFDDLFVAALVGPTIDNTLFIFRGGAAGLSRTPSTIIQTEQGNSKFGAAVSGAGDVDGDGFSDLVASAPWFDTSGGGFLAGRVYVFHGSPSF